VILIVGAGPTGLSLAIELARRGVPFRIVDKATRRSDKSRALAVQARSLELMRPWGVADELVARGQKAFAAQFFVDGIMASGMGVDDISPSDIEGVEIFAGAAGLPSEFGRMRSTSNCGTVLIWTRIPG